MKKYCKRYIRQPDGSLKLDWIDKPVVNYGESVTDKSKYKPNVPLYSQIDFNKGMPDNLCYDFPDGKDTGLDLTPLRNKSLDITEIADIKRSLEASTKRQKKAIDDEVDKLLKEQSESKQSQAQASDNTSE